MRSILEKALSETENTGDWVSSGDFALQLLCVACLFVMFLPIFKITIPHRLYRLPVGVREGMVYIES